MLRIAVVTDIHFGFDTPGRLGSRAPALVENFVRTTNEFQADLILDLGDRITSQSHDLDKSFLRRLREKYAEAAAPCHGVMGNNDLRNISALDNHILLGFAPESNSFDLNGFHLALWNPDVTNYRDGKLILDAESLEWLVCDLAATDLPTLVFSHAPPNAYRDEDCARITALMKESDQVALAMGGHLHAAGYETHNGIPVITQQSLVHDMGDQTPVGAFSLVTCDHHQIRITGFGIGQPSYRIPVRRPGPPPRALKPAA